jgi:hypothetical protein
LKYNVLIMAKDKQHVKQNLLREQTNFYSFWSHARGWFF